MVWLISLFVKSCGFWKDEAGFSFGAISSYTLQSFTIMNTSITSVCLIIKGFPFLSGLNQSQLLENSINNLVKLCCDF